MMKLSQISNINIYFILTCVIIFDSAYSEGNIKTPQASKVMDEHLIKIDRIIPNRITTKLQYQQVIDNLFQELAKVSDQEIVQYIYAIDQSSIVEDKKDLSMGILFLRLRQHDLLLEVLSQVQNIPWSAGWRPLSLHLYECGISAQEIETLKNKAEKDSTKKERFALILLEYMEGYIPISAPLTERIPLNK
ncbi:hypothetical protein [Akkermansia glycaniphila]|uniref:Uncharacterized protein n=1 Tax=Akkermansia glycaniphila TaxID=1679444 RepID=A0A1H6MG76_9BACT|nr:hypothetical protein [Akkermansia glycaniphila]SEH96871.1 Hypothetical protein PYTT_2168 [Akkermansia glycaniphila]